MALLSIAVIATVNPSLPREQAHALAERSKTRETILGFVRSVGLRWIASTPISEVCDRLEHFDSQVRLNIIINGSGCLPSGFLHYGYSNVSLSLGGLAVILEAWVPDASR